jgi:hypothetical protein
MFEVVFYRSHLSFFFILVEVQVDGKPIRLELCDTAGEVNVFFFLCSPHYLAPRTASS